jgi:hypothetical protein
VVIELLLIGIVQFGVSGGIGLTPIPTGEQLSIFAKEVIEDMPLVIIGIWILISNL